MSNKIFELAKKLKALADRGEGGEKMNAEEMLKRLMNEHGISLEDISTVERKTHWFKIRTEQEMLFQQICASIYGEVKFWTHKDRRGQTGAELSPGEALTAHAMFEWYWKLYVEEIKVFYTAFVMKHSLYRNAPPVSEKELSAEELERRRRAGAMANGLKDQSFTKRLMHRHGQKQ